VIGEFLVLLALTGGPVEAVKASPEPSGASKRVCRRKCRMRRRVRPWNAKLERMADCESDKRWHLDAYHDGGLQFHPDTWWATGATGYAWQHTKLEQKYRAVIWHDKIGTWVTSAGWPNCGYA